MSRPGTTEEVKTEIHLNNILHVKELQMEKNGKKNGKMRTAFIINDNYPNLQTL